MASLSKNKGKAVAASMLETKSAGAVSESEEDVRCETVVSFSPDQFWPQF